MITGPAKRAEARVLRRRQPHKEENTRPSRKLVQGRSIWRSVSCSKLLAGTELQMRSDALAPQEPKNEKSLGQCGRCEHSATPSKFFQRNYSFRHERPHFFLIARERTQFDGSSASDATVSTILPTRIPYETRQSKGCISKTMALAVRLPNAMPRATHPGESRESRPRSVHSLREQRASRLRGQVFPLPFANQPHRCRILILHGPFPVISASANLARDRCDGGRRFSPAGHPVDRPNF